MTAALAPHPYADKFPMLPDSELADLAESIRENGLRQPIVVTPEGLILDGRNRYAACESIGLTPETVVYEGDDLAEYVIDCNVTRRNMTTGARAMATALVLQTDGRRENGRWKYGEVSESFGQKYAAGLAVAVSKAGIILDYAPDLSPNVVSGDLALNAAYERADAIRRSAESEKIREREARKREREETKADAERNAKIVGDLTVAKSKYVALIESGEMTPAAAWAAHREDTRKEREQAEADRKNEEQSIQSTCEALAALMPLEHAQMRAHKIAIFPARQEAVRPAARELFIPPNIRRIATWLNTLANELEASR